MQKMSATFSPCRTYRYTLTRKWLTGAGTACFIMLNGSKADEVSNDPSVERCERRTRSWGYRRLEVRNIFGLMSTDPQALYGHPDPIGPDNDAAILDAALRSDIVICGWGLHGKLHGRGAAVLGLLASAGVRPHALRLTKDGTPGHPLYVPYSCTPISMEVPNGYGNRS